jgi:hypothetical protein
MNLRQPCLAPESYFKSLGKLGLISPLLLPAQQPHGGNGRQGDGFSHRDLIGCLIDHAAADRRCDSSCDEHPRTLLRATIRALIIATNLIEPE